MAILSYVLGLSANMADNPYLTADFHQMQGERWFPYISADHRRVGDGLAYSLETHYPISTHTRRIDAVVTQSYVDDFYYRIHMDTLEANLGVVASEQVLTFNLWNAYFEPLNLMAIEGLGLGTYFEAQDLAPLTLFALQERAWKLHILPDGEARLNLGLNWRFTGQHSQNRYQASSHIHGQRVIGFTWAIDWAKGVNETLAWHTDILQSQTGHEQRRSLRLSPRMDLEVSLLLYQHQRTLFDLTMIGWSAKTFIIPLWFYVDRLQQDLQLNQVKIQCNTVDIPFANYPYLMLMNEHTLTYEVAEIQHVTATHIILKRPLQSQWLIGTQLYPAVSAFIQQQPQLIKRNSQTMRTNVQFQVLDLITHTPTSFAQGEIDEFKGYPVLNIPPNESQDLTHSYQRLQQQLDTISSQPLIVDIANASFVLYQYRWLLQGIAQHQQFYTWLQLLNGRQKAVWLPTFSEDLLMVNTIQSASKTLDIAYCGYSKFAQRQTGRQHILITLQTGERIYQKIISAQEMGDLERLTVEQAFTKNISVQQVRHIQFISLCRLNSDSVHIQHQHDIQGLSIVEMSFRGIREDD